MFREILGLPGHVLLVHAAVVFIPLLALLATAYALLPRWRGKLDWAVAILAVAAPVAAFLTTESGEELQAVLTEKNYPPEILSQVQQHADYGDRLWWCTLALGLVSILLLLATSDHPRFRRVPSWTRPVLSALVIALAVVVLVYVYLTGDTGAEAVWQGVL